MAVTLRSKSFMLRPFRKGDELSLQRNINDKDISRFTITIPNPYTMKDARKWVRSSIALNKKRKKAEVRFAIAMRDEVIGGITLMHIEGHKAELGYWLAKRHWGRGIMTAAAKLVCNFGFRRLKLKRIYATVLPENKASSRVLKKAGFELEGKLRKLHKRKEEFLDALLYAKVR